MRRTDVIASLVIGEVSALLLLTIGFNLRPPSGIRMLLAWLPILFPLFTLGVMAVGALIGRKLAIAYQFAKFALVGGMNFLVDLGVLNLLIFATGVAAGFYAAVFKAIAFLVAVSSSFLWNKFWTFRSLSTAHVGTQFFEFLVVSGVGLGINVGAFALLNEAVGPPEGIRPETWASASAAGAAVVGLVWNFVGYKFFVFRRAK